MELVTTQMTERQRKYHETSPYEIGLDKNAANYVPLTPLAFLKRSAAVFPARAAVVYAQWSMASAVTAGVRRITAVANWPRHWRRMVLAAAIPWR